MKHVRLFPKGASGYGFAYLINLGIPAAFLADLSPAWRIVSGAILLMIFAGVYISTYWVDEKILWMCGLTEVLLMCGLLWVGGPGYYWMVFWPAALLGTVHSVRRAYLGLIALVVLGAVEIALWDFVYPEQTSGFYWLFFVAGTFGAVATMFGVRVNIQLREAKERLEAANATIAKLAQETERNRISQDLHDVMGHELSMISLKAQVAARFLATTDAQRARQEVRDIEQGARNALKRVREYVGQIRQPEFDAEWEAAKAILQTAGLAVDAASFPSTPPDPAAGVLAMCLREAATNIVRHSQAHSVWMRGVQEHKRICLAVADDGKGCTQGPQEVQGFGLRGMRARLASIGGELHIWSNGQPLMGTEKSSYKFTGKIATPMDSEETRNILGLHEVFVLNGAGDPLFPRSKGMSLWMEIPVRERDG